MLSIQLLAALACLSSGVLSAAVPLDARLEARLAVPFCKTYGVDYQQGGSYFINTNSNASFTFVSKFEGCQNDTASLMLVNESTGDQYDCGTVPTVPGDTPQTATCQVQNNQLVSGKYLIIAIGNNGDGQPFSYEREFSLDAGPQQTVTAYPTKTVTSTPIQTVTSISFYNSTQTVPNKSTVTEYKGTHTETITPSPVWVTETKTITHTFDPWTKSNHITTVTVTPTCRIPLRQRHPDPICRFKYRNGRLRDGWRGGRPAIDDNPRRRNFTGTRPDRLHDIPPPRMPIPINHFPEATAAPKLKKRAPDNRTTTVDGPTSGESTLTITAASSTQTNVVVVTTTYTITSPPKTTWGGEAQQNVTLPTSTKTIVRIVYTRQYVTKTWGWTWTKTAVNRSSAEATKCRNQGGHYGHW